MMSDKKIPLEQCGNTSDDRLISPQVDNENVTIFDPRNHKRIVKQRLYALEIIHERFALKLGNILFQLLHRTADVILTSLKIESFDDCIRSQSEQTYQCLVNISPLQGAALFIYSSPLTAMLVEQLFGGDGNCLPYHQERSLSATEQRIVKQFINASLPAYDDAWQILCDIKSELLRTEAKINFAPITSALTDSVVTATFSIQLGKQHGQLAICLPLKMLEPLGDKLTALPSGRQTTEQHGWHRHFRQQVKKTKLALIAKLHDKQLSLAEVLALKQGDVIPIDKHQTIRCTAHDVAVFTAHYGCVGDQYALQVDSILTCALRTLEKEFSCHEQNR